MERQQQEQTEHGKRFLSRFEQIRALRERREQRERELISQAKAARPGADRI